METPSPPFRAFVIYGHPLNKYKYLGIKISNKNQTNLYIEHFKNTIETAEKRFHRIFHNGFHRDGLRPETAIKLYKLMVRPILEYGSQVLTYQNHYLKSLNRVPKDLNILTNFEEKLEQFQTKALKTLIGAPKSTLPAIVRFFSGVEPLKSRLDMLKLRYFWNLVHVYDHSIAYHVFKYRKEQY